MIPEDFDYDLPERLIASRPPKRRNDARMLVLHRQSGRLEHRTISDFPSYLRPGDLAVLNDSRVFKARVWSDDRRIEFLFIREIEPLVWECLAKPGKRLKLGVPIAIAGTTLYVRSFLPDGSRVVELAAAIDFDRYGEIPIPPYFQRPADSADDERYQTVYARQSGSVAAPTAGLHFTPELLASIPHSFLTLHVGPGTFRPVKADRIEEHRMHAEEYAVSARTAAGINAAKRIIAIGTTTARVLESLPPGPVAECQGSTSIFIHPPYEFRRVGALLTNFHLPRSTLLMLVSAFASREQVLAAYREAIASEYRFFSYGDCMFIL